MIAFCLVSIEAASCTLMPPWREQRHEWPFTNHQWNAGRRYVFRVISGKNCLPAPA